LMRIALDPRLRVGNADLYQELDRALTRRLPGEAPMQQQNLADLLLDGMQRIERGHRLLENDGDVVAAHTANLVFRQAQMVLALEADRAGGMVRRRVRQKLQHR